MSTCVDRGGSRKTYYRNFYHKSDVLLYVWESLYVEFFNKFVNCKSKTQAKFSINRARLLIFLLSGMNAAGFLRFWKKII